MPIPRNDAAPSRKLLRDQVLERLRAAILDGTLAPGERLHDEELISWLGVSRTPIREALGTLAHEGLIEMVPNRYTRVATPSAGDVLDAFRALGIILGGIVRTTLPVLTEPQRQTIIDRLNTELDRLRNPTATHRSVTDINSSYQTWLTLCPNTALVTIGEHALHGLIYRLRVDAAHEVIPVDHLLEHLTVFRDAITAGNPIQAELAIEAAHMLDHDTTVPTAISS